MKPGRFVVLSKTSALGLGTFSELPWHKKERENILRGLDIKVEHGERLKEAKDKGTFTTVGDREHGELIEMYASGKSMMEIAEVTKRSSGTVGSHIHKHDDAVERSGFCPRCRRIKNQHTKVKVFRSAA